MIQYSKYKLFFFIFLGNAKCSFDMIFKRYDSSKIFKITKNDCKIINKENLRKMNKIEHILLQRLIIILRKRLIKKKQIIKNRAI